MKNIKTAKLTLKAAKALAVIVMGTCKGLELLSDDGIYQQYSMHVGKFYVLITNDCGYWGVTRNVTRLSASTDRGGAEHYFDTITLEETDGRSCRVCGCTEYNACPGGCYWVDDDLYNKCKEETNA